MDWTWTAKRRRQFCRGALATCSLTMSACAGSQSILEPAGMQAASIAKLFWWMFGGGALVWILVVAAALYVIKVQPGERQVRKDQWLIVGGGILFPAAVLSALLVYGLSLMPHSRLNEQADLNVNVAGEQWWWRVQYETTEGEVVELANEIRLPVDKSALFNLTSDNVIHSFWIPSLGGKVDMIPGRTNQMLLEPTRTGIFSGACAEYCGTSHTFMRFRVQVMKQQAFEHWLTHQAQPARPPATAAASEGLRIFMSNGCATCHTIRGTDASGRLGPDLTHVGSRLSLAAGTLPMAPASFVSWIDHTRNIKPGADMPPFAVLGEDKLDALAAYLSGLE